ncbi:MAG: hypothetical protein JO001_27670 [Alphaproteobacteria bacterium]|nr:hypothetical protein [Alphaproteobacteria bacterium]
MDATIALPAVSHLETIVCQALSEAAERAEGGMTTNICDVLDRELKKHVPHIESAFGRSLTITEDRREFLVDFSAILCEPRELNVERYTTQVLVAGEIEASSNLGRDFDKLLYIDSLVYFFAFDNRINEHKKFGTSDLEFFLGVASRRIRHLNSRGVKPLPSFILSAFDQRARSCETRLINGSTI